MAWHLLSLALSSIINRQAKGGEEGRQAENRHFLSSLSLSPPLPLSSLGSWMDGSLSILTALFALHVSGVGVEEADDMVGVFGVASASCVFHAHRHNSALFITHKRNIMRA